jgi:hypothetical protein
VPPLTESKVRDVFENVVPVDAGILRGMEERALAGIDFCFRT